MARITVEDSLKQETNRFALVILAARRARMLLSGAKNLVESKNKPVVTALREIAHGDVRFMSEADQKIKEENERLERERRLAEAALEASTTAEADSLFKEEVDTSEEAVAEQINADDLFKTEADSANLSEEPAALEAEAPAEEPVADEAKASAEEVAIAETETSSEAGEEKVGETQTQVG